MKLLGCDTRLPDPAEGSVRLNRGAQVKGKQLRFQLVVATRPTPAFFSRRLSSGLHHIKMLGSSFPANDRIHV
jgi:hypothetical protein